MEMLLRIMSVTATGAALNDPYDFAALPQHMAVSLWLTVGKPEG
jgi:hypothetical protein